MCSIPQGRLEWTGHSCLHVKNADAVSLFRGYQWRLHWWPFTILDQIPDLSHLFYTSQTLHVPQRWLPRLCFSNAFSFTLHSLCCLLICLNWKLPPLRISCNVLHHISRAATLASFLITTKSTYQALIILQALIFYCNDLSLLISFHNHSLNMILN